jgi:Na+/melibiose symporter-like transporter
MYPATFTTNEQMNWKATLQRSPWSSRHFIMVVIYNLLNLIQLIWMLRLYRNAPHLGVFVILIVFMLIMLGHSAVVFYKQTRERLKALPEESEEAQSLLRISYRGYRLYVLGLGYGFILLGIFHILQH